MNKSLKNILNKLDKNGYEAYLVGGFVRDYLVGKKTTDIDICTNALPEDLYKLFPTNKANNNYGSYNFKIKNYNVDITTYRKELEYTKRKPTKLEYIKTLEEDLNRRDFTINAICMDRKENIIDLVGGQNDLNNRIIKIIGNPDKKLQEDPLRILRAIRFATTLDFTIDKELDKSIKKNITLIKELSDIRIKNELNKILLDKNFNKGLTLLKEYKILSLLDITYKNINYVADEYGMWAQLETSKNYGFTKQELMNIINIRQIISDKVINNHTLYKYELYTSLVAGKIINIDDKVINKMFNNLPLKSSKDLKITNEEIIKVLNIEPSKKLKNIKDELISLILDGKLKNKKSELKKYIQRKEM